jgi:hypothetical protein
MPPSQSYFFDVILVGLGLFYITYVGYGRIKQKPLVKSIEGDYRSGRPDHEVFLKFVNNSKLLIIVTLASLLFVVNLVFDLRAALRESTSHSILVVAPPLMFIVALIIVLTVAPRIFGGKK